MAAENISKRKDQGQAAFDAGQFMESAQFFRMAAEDYSAVNDHLMAAEMMNNCSVALLKSGHAEQALAAAQGTEEVFAAAYDLRRQAIALGNQAAALDAGGQSIKALDAYRMADNLLKQIGEKEMRCYLLRDISALQVKSGNHLEAMASMHTALDLKKDLTLKERIFNHLLKIPFRMLRSD